MHTRPGRAARRLHRPADPIASPARVHRVFPDGRPRRARGGAVPRRPPGAWPPSPRAMPGLRLATFSTSGPSMASGTPPPAHSAPSSPRARRCVVHAPVDVVVGPETRENPASAAALAASRTSPQDAPNVSRRTSTCTASVWQGPHCVETWLCRPGTCTASPATAEAEPAPTAATARRLPRQCLVSARSCLATSTKAKPTRQTPSPNFAQLFDPQGPLAVCYDLPGFDTGARPGTFDSCGIRNRLDYIFVTRDLVPLVTAGGLVRTGLWGTRKTRPTDWTTYPDMTGHDQQASDHAAVFLDLAL